jgi:hypothetical protein
MVMSAKKKLWRLKRGSHLGNTSTQTCAPDYAPNTRFRFGKESLWRVLNLAFLSLAADGRMQLALGLSSLATNKEDCHELYLL